MCEGCFLLTRLSKLLSVSVDQKTRPRIHFEKCGGAFETLSRAFDGLKEFEALGRVFLL